MDDWRTLLFDTGLSRGDTVMMNDEGERGAVYKCSDLTTTHEHMCTTEGKQMFATLDWGGLVSAVNYDVKFDGEGQFGILQVENTGATPAEIYSLWFDNGYRVDGGGALYLKVSTGSFF